MFVSGSTDKKMFLYEGKECNELKELTTAKPHNRTITSIGWVDAKNFVTSSNDTTVKLWNVDSDDAVVKTFRVSE